MRMDSKQRWLALLICVNLVLLTAIVLVGTTPPVARAQGTGLAPNYMMVAGEIQDQHDALYVIDVKDRVLFAFEFDRTDRTLVPRDARDLERDFRRNRD
jgi:hypothetical protein